MLSFFSWFKYSRFFRLLQFFGNLQVFTKWPISQEILKQGRKMLHILSERSYHCMMLKPVRFLGTASIYKTFFASYSWKNSNNLCCRKIDGWKVWNFSSDLRERRKRKGIWKTIFCSSSLLFITTKQYWQTDCFLPNRSLRRQKRGALVGGKAQK